MIQAGDAVCVVPGSGRRYGGVTTTGVAVLRMRKGAWLHQSWAGDHPVDHPGDSWFNVAGIPALERVTWLEPGEIALVTEALDLGQERAVGPYEGQRCVAWLSRYAQERDMWVHLFVERAAVEAGRVQIIRAGEAQA